MLTVNLFGLINTIFITISVYGLFAQIKTIWLRKNHPAQCNNNSSLHSPTALLSLNQFSVSYFAYLSFFVYGYSIDPFNHYIVWPRLVASVIVLLILFEIWRDRKTIWSRRSFYTALISLLLALFGLAFSESHSMVDHGKYIATSIMIIVSVLIAQGYAHQIKVIIQFGDTGAINLKMSQFILLMDISTIAFALSLGINDGWPLLVLAITSAITKLIIMYLFRWVKTSEAAAQRRALAYENR